MAGCLFVAEEEAGDGMDGLCEGALSSSHLYLEGEGHYQPVFAESSLETTEASPRQNFWVSFCVLC